MAVINKIPGLKVEIIANGEPLPEYDDEDVDNSASKITKFIQVSPDSAFEVIVQFLDEYVATRGVRIKIRLDGVKVSSRLIALNGLKRKGGHKFSGVSSKINNRWNESNFKLMPFAIENDSGKKLDEATAHRLSKAGTITVILHRVKNLRRPRKSRPPVAENANVVHSVSVFKTVPEKRVQKLDLLHHGGVGDPQQKRGGKSSTYNWVDGGEDEHAYATFNFEYRSLDALKTLHIVPRTTPPLAPQTAPAQPAPAAHNPVPTAIQAEEYGGLSLEELISIITAYRGHSNGLAGLTQQALSVLLRYHMKAETPVRRIKHERNNDVEMYDGEKKRRPEVIDLTE